MDTNRKVLDLSTPPPKLDWVVEEFITRGDRVVMYGEFSSGKSWVAAHLGLTIASGSAPGGWLGRFPVPRSRPVLYVDEENPIDTQWIRVNRLHRGLGLTPGTVPFHVLPRAGVIMRSSEPSMLLQWMKNNGLEDVEVLIFDTLRRILEGDENHNADVIKFWRTIEVLMKAGKTVIVLHHMNKPPTELVREARHRASGATDILAGADVAYSLNGTGEEGLVTIKGEKSRNMEQDRGFTVHWYDHGNREGPMWLELAKPPEKGAPHLGWGKGSQVCSP